MSLLTVTFLAFFSLIANGDNSRNKMDNSHTKCLWTINYSSGITKREKNQEGTKKKYSQLNSLKIV